LDDEPSINENAEEWYEAEPLLKFQFSWTKFFSFVGPGLLMSIAYLDPGNIAGDLSAGVSSQYQIVWTLTSSTFIGCYYQNLASKIGVCTQRSLAVNIRE
jgi:natural resistance-associated macrophage protein 2